MILTLTFVMDLTGAQRAAVRSSLDRLAGEWVISSYRSPYWRDESQGDRYLVEIDDVNAYGTDRDHGEECRIAEAIVETIIRAVPTARFMVAVIVEHCCTGCNHDCETEETIWTTFPRWTPEERAIVAIAMEAAT